MPVVAPLHHRSLRYSPQKRLRADPRQQVGIRVEGRWTPTYIKQELAGWWCDPYWGCYVTSGYQFANQIELAGGLVLRF